MKKEKGKSNWMQPKDDAPNGYISVKKKKKQAKEQRAVSQITPKT